jgi:hypothetical protein
LIAEKPAEAGHRCEAWCSFEFMFTSCGRL